MQVVPASNAGFLPYTPPTTGGGTATGPAVDHMARVTADDGQGIDQAATTALFNLFPNQALPQSLAAGHCCAPFLGYKLDGNNRVVKMYSISGAAHDLVIVAGAGGPAIEANALGGQAVVNFATGLLREPDATVGDTEEYSVVSVFADPPEGSGIMTFSFITQTFLTIFKIYGGLGFSHTFNYGNNGVGLYRLPWIAVHLGWKRDRTPDQLQGYCNDQFTGNGGNVTGSYSAVNDWYWGNGQSYGYPSNGGGARIAAMARLTLDDIPTRTALYTFFKSFYALTF